MCGIVGVLNDKDLSNLVLKNMTKSLNHRGPDALDIWTDSRYGLGFGHTRLSILDLSNQGNQPMVSRDNKMVIIFNGEIYNHIKLREEINKVKNFEWKGYSDTETLIEYISHFGIKKTLNKIIGMFAFGLWNKETKELIIARDHMGQKPLYYGWEGKIFFFASELKAIKLHPKFKGVKNLHAISDLLNYNYIPDKKSIYENLLKLEPGHYLKLPFSNLNNNKIKEAQIIKYWSANSTNLDIYNGDIDYFSNKLENLLLKSVDMQMLSDVPLGAFLSGGIDSSLIVSLMQLRSSLKIKTFTIGFEEKEFNEAENAKKIASHIGTDHNELYCTERDILDLIPQLPTIYDEPFSDPSALPSIILSKLTKEYVSVALSGDGGDEIFGGYNRYNSITQIDAYKNNPIINKLIDPFSKLISYLNDQNIDRLGRFRNIDQLSDKLRKVSLIIDSKNKVDSFQRILKNSNFTDKLINFNIKEDFILDKIKKNNFENDFINLMMLVDRETYLPGDVLVKVDRASMSQSLETRAPFLDHNIIEFSNSLPMSMKAHNGNSKIILRKILYKYCDKNLFTNQKKGFNIPIDNWLRNSLKTWANDIFNSTEFMHSEYFNVDEVKKIWDQHVSGKFNWYRPLWSILMLQVWLNDNR